MLFVSHLLSIPVSYTFVTKHSCMPIFLLQTNLNISSNPQLYTPPLFTVYTNNNSACSLTASLAASRMVRTRATASSSGRTVPTALFMSSRLQPMAPRTIASLIVSARAARSLPLPSWRSTVTRRSGLMRWMAVMMVLRAERF